MEAHDAAEVSPGAPRYHHRDDIEGSVARANEQTHNHRQQPTISQLVRTFRNNVELRFGDDSSEVTTIQDVLGKFQYGQTAKRDAMNKMMEVLGDQSDLKRDLMSVLFHPDADWAPDDFDFDFHQPRPITQPSPQFLQPDHQLQMRLPPISPSWNTDHQTHQSISPAVLGGYGEPQGFHHSVSPQMHQVPHRFHYPSAFTSPAETESARYVSYGGDGYEAETSPARQQFDHAPQPDHVRIQWEQEDHSDDPQLHRSQRWSPVQSNSLLGRTQSFASDHVQSPALPHDAYTPQDTSPEEEKFVTPGPSILGTPVAVPIGQPTDDMPPPSRKRRRINSSAPFKTEEITRDDSAEASARASPPAKVPSKRTAQRQAKKKAEEDQAQSAVGEPYIHSICGKGFASKSKVKKHHWGYKMDNLETTSGCWAKHNKPDVDWNEHVSCREGAPPPCAVKKPTESRSRKKALTQNAPVVPTMIPSLEDLPQAVYDAVNQRKADQHTFQDVGSFHSHRLPTGGGDFNSLLTAVNVASYIDAPRPQGRNDSVVDHLHAQAAAAEETRQHVTSWIDASHSHEDEAFTYGHHHPYTIHELGISYPVGGVHVPLDVALPLQRGNYMRTPSSGSPQDMSWDQDRMYQISDVRLNQTAFEPTFPPYPDQMRRQI